LPPADQLAWDDAARDGLIRLADGPDDLEVRLRARRLLARLLHGSPARVCEQRAVLVLEVAGTPEARALLLRLASGAKGAVLTEEARAALARLKAARPVGR
jgi:hypothetical protein